MRRVAILALLATAVLAAVFAFAAALNVTSAKLTVVGNTLNTTSISTTPSAGGPVGTTLNDSATLSGGTTAPAATGTISFKLFPPTDGTCAGTASYTDIVTISGNGTYSTAAGNNPGGFIANSAGTWHWTVSYSGDGNNQPASSACASEPATITQLTPTVVTEIHNASEAVVTSVPAGTTVHDKATVSGSFGTPAGSVTFTFYSASSACTGSSVGAGTVTLVSGVAHPSTPANGPLSAGSYSYQAHYNGDTNYAAADSGCEALTVTAVSGTLYLKSATTSGGDTLTTNSSTSGVTNRLLDRGASAVWGTATSVTFNGNSGWVLNLTGTVNVQNPTVEIWLQQSGSSCPASPGGTFVELLSPTTQAITLSGSNLGSTSLTVSGSVAAGTTGLMCVKIANSNSGSGHTTTINTSGTSSFLTGQFTP